MHAISENTYQSGNPLLLINHIPRLFRTEVHVEWVEEGYKAYGAVTWGQFFVLSGFNEKNEMDAIRLTYTMWWTNL